MGAPPATETKPPSPASADSLSRRIQPNISYSDPLWGNLARLDQNRYHPTDNPSGIINLGVAENWLMRDTLVNYLAPRVKITGDQLGYGSDTCGSPQLRSLIAQLFNDHFQPGLRIEADHVSVHNGTSSVIDIVSYVVCDPGDIILAAAPYYGGFNFDTFSRSGVRMLPVPMTPNQMMDPDEHIRLMEAAFQQQQQQQTTVPGTGEPNKARVRAIIFTNPHNPFGLCHPRVLIEQLLRFAQRHHLHILFDEIYALSGFASDINALSDQNPAEAAALSQLRKAEEALLLEGGEGSVQLGTSFHSALSINHDRLTELIDPSLVHVLHGMSKDFGSGGLRIGYLVSPWNPTFRAAVRSVAAFSWFSGTAEQIAMQYLSDPVWRDGYLADNRRALARAYVTTAGFLVCHGIPFVPARAGPFIWLDLRSYGPPPPTGRPTSPGVMGGESHDSLVSAVRGEEENEDVTTTTTTTTTTTAAAAAAPVAPGRRIHSVSTLMEQLYQAGVYLAPGYGFEASEPGWFRLTFANPPEVMAEALVRLRQALNIDRVGQ
ncbi:hypothetical protein H4R33_002123 [Dimargaris cristalligena]|nr:hypothetical protein H4R33_002123 [Dimargaris cristalligena]